MNPAPLALQVLRISAMLAKGRHFHFGVSPAPGEQIGW
jgi:hypothetical protein